MKTKVLNLFLSAAAFVFAFSAYAQEDLPVLETQDPIHREFNLDEDKTLIYEHSAHPATNRDADVAAPSTVSHQQPVNKVTKPDHNSKSKSKEKEEDDALSFNVIFYMIQKFKLSDLIDQ
ncbi:MAG: hypothetical protein K2U26_08145 [Cyclobacteriaceae bacterium]|nr:hypothetical protein [Cyclobacteriaceae bacterium]